MEDMAAVLFIVTVPTEAVEIRLKAEFIARKLDIRSDQIDITTLSTTLATATETETADTDQKSLASNEETVSASKVELGSQGSAKAFTTNFNTFPKRRSQSEIDTKSAKDLKTKEQIKPESGSLKEIKSESNVRKLANSQETPFISRKSAESLRDMFSSIKQKSDSKKSLNNIDMAIPNNTCMEKVVREILKKFQVGNAVWTKDSQGQKYQIIFTIEFNEIYEKILEKFYEWGIGDREGSSVSVMNCIVAKTYTQENESEAADDLNKENLNAQQKQSAWEKFMNSVQSRLNVAQIIRDVRQNASITFDFLILLISAAILASFGLIEDSVVFLASSMLISPLMGPIIAAVFGTVIKDNSLRMLGVKNEIFGILVAILIGFIFGLIVCSIDERYSIGDGLTTEMLSRCEIHSLLVGIFTAIPSGAAGAVGILGGNVGSLVGVAISASLLPPAVNSGLLWALACIYKYYETDTTRYPNVVKTHTYSENQATELAVLGLISMCLTISNVICVYVVGVIVLKVKEIAPVMAQNNREFWKRDIKIARVISRNYANCKTGTDAAIIDEFANLPKEDQKALGINSDMLRKINSLDRTSYQNTWSPYGNQQLYETRYEPRLENYSTVHHLERLYSTITNQRDNFIDKRPRFSFAQRPTGRRTDLGGLSYRLLAEKRPRCATMPEETALRSNVRFSQSNRTTPSDERSELETPTGPNDERKRRKFIVTPAAEDPLLSRDSKNSET